MQSFCVVWQSSVQTLYPDLHSDIPSLRQGRPWCVMSGGLVP
jgi:hypothetical protein